METTTYASSSFLSETANKIRFENQIATEDIEILSFENVSENDELIIVLHSHLFLSGKYEVVLRSGGKINILISEIVSLKLAGQKYDWQNFYHQPYIRMRNIGILLPGDNFYLIKHYLIPEQFLLKIILGRVTDN